MNFHYCILTESNGRIEWKKGVIYQTAIQSFHGDDWEEAFASFWEKNYASEKGRVYLLPSSGGFSPPPPWAITAMEKVKEELGLEIPMEEGKNMVAISLLKDQDPVSPRLKVLDPDGKEWEICMISVK